MKLDYKSTNNSKQKQKQAKTAKPASVAQPHAEARPAAVKSLSAQPMSAAEFRADIKAQQLKRLLGQVDPQTEELVDVIMGIRAVAPVAATAKADRVGKAIKLGIDVHLDRYVVVRQIDGGAPQPPQRFSPSQFLAWAQKQTQLAEKVYSCYEAGPFGYGLHRDLLALARIFHKAPDFSRPTWVFWEKSARTAAFFRLGCPAGRDHLLCQTKRPFLKTPLP